MLCFLFISFFFFFFNDTATTEIYTLSLHDALPILPTAHFTSPGRGGWQSSWQDRKSTRLNSSHANISYAVFCLKKKKKLKIVFSYKKKKNKTKKKTNNKNKI